MLYVVATPIGNLRDITLRALEVLKSADVIAAEDTRHSGNLLRHFEIRKPLVSYHEHNEAMRTAELIERLAAGENIALITDAGMPGSFRSGRATAAQMHRARPGLHNCAGAILDSNSVGRLGVLSGSILFWRISAGEKRPTRT